MSLPRQSFLRAGHLPTLVAAFLYFDASFMVWVLLGPLGVQIGNALHLDASEKGLMVATPVLAGAALRIAAGLAADRFGTRRAGIAAQTIVIAGLVAASQFGLHNFAATLVLGVVLGLAGASFAIALPLASRWYPPEHQGTALGIAGAGNSGTVLAALFAPTLAATFGVNGVFGLAACILAAVLALFVAIAKDSPTHPAPQTLARYFAVLRVRDTWMFMLFYAVTFGGFVGLAASLTIYFHTQYGLAPVAAGEATAACVFAGSLFRPVGGAIADRAGGLATLSVLYLVAASALVLVSFGLPSLPLALCVFVVGMLALGMGNGAVFQLVPLRFGREIGVMTGLVGMAGGIGGFTLASSLGTARQLTGSYQAAFLLFAGLALIAFVCVQRVKKPWRDRTPADTALVRL